MSWINDLMNKAVVGVANQGTKDAREQRAGINAYSKSLQPSHQDLQYMIDNDPENLQAFRETALARNQATKQLTDPLTQQIAQRRAQTASGRMFGDGLVGAFLNPIGQTAGLGQASWQKYLNNDSSLMDMRRNQAGITPWSDVGAVANTAGMFAIPGGAGISGIGAIAGKQGAKAIGTALAKDAAFGAGLGAAQHLQDTGGFKGIGGSMIGGGLMGAALPSSIGLTRRFGANKLATKGVQNPSAVKQWFNGLGTWGGALGGAGIAGAGVLGSSLATPDYQELLAENQNRQPMTEDERWFNSLSPEEQAYMYQVLGGY
jgi:hypothetical protein